MPQRLGLDLPPVDGQVLQFGVADRRPALRHVTCRSQANGQRPVEQVDAEATFVAVEHDHELVRRPDRLVRRGPADDYLDGRDEALDVAAANDLGAPAGAIGPHIVEADDADFRLQHELSVKLILHRPVFVFVLDTGGGGSVDVDEIADGGLACVRLVRRHQDERLAAWPAMTERHRQEGGDSIGAVSVRLPLHHVQERVDLVHPAPD